MWRWIRRIAILLVVLALLGAGAIQLLLWSDTPRQWIVAELRKETGLAVEIGSLRTGWLGHTSLHDVRVSLPGETTPMATVDDVTLDHSCLATIVLIGAVDFHVIHAGKVDLRLTQEPTGWWNVERMLALLDTGGATGTDNPLAALRSATVDDLTIQVQDATGRSATIAGIVLEATGTGPGALQFEAKTPANATLSGQIVMRGQWAHQAHLTLADAHQIAGPWLRDLPAPMAADVKWDGSITQGRLAGQLTVRKGTSGPYELTGSAVASSDLSYIAAQSIDMTLRSADGQTPTVRCRGGELRLESEKVTWQRVELAAVDTTARIEGEYRFADRAGRVKGEWVGKVDRIAAEHSGTLEGTLSESVRGMKATVKLSSAGHIPDARWAGDVDITASGAKWDTWSWQLTAKAGEIALVSAKGDDDVSAPRAVPLTGLTMKGSVAWPRIDVTELRHTLGSPVQGTGWFDASTMQWEAKLAGDAVRIKDWLPAPVDMDVALRGDRQRITLARGRASGDMFELDASGDYSLVSEGDQPLQLNITAAAWQGQVTRADKDAAPQPSIAAASPTPAEPTASPTTATPPAPSTPVKTATPAAGAAWRGLVSFTGSVAGAVSPLKLTAQGRVTADQIVARGQPLATTQFNLDAAIDSDRVKARTTDFDLLDGRARIDTTYALGDETIDLALHLQRGSLETVAPMIAAQLKLRGQTEADLTLSLPIREPSKLRVDGRFRVESFHYNSDVSFDAITGRLRTREPGVVSLEAVTAERGDGRATGGMLVDLRDGVRGKAEIDCRAWPVEILTLGASARIDGRVNFDADLLAHTMQGDFNVAAAATAREQSLGTLHLTGRYTADEVRVTLSDSTVLGGSARGEATLYPGKWWTSRGEVTWRGIEAGAIRPWLAEAAHLSGATQGRVTFGPATSDRAPEPMRIDLTVDSNQPLQYRGVAWGSVRGVAHAGPSRVLLDQMTLNVAGGEASVWASLQQHDGAWRDHLIVQLQDIDMSQLRTAFAVEGDKPLVGRVSGDVNLFGKLGDWADHGGDGRLVITGSDLHHISILGSVVALTGVKVNKEKGTGVAEFRLEAGTLNVNRFVYRNGSTEILMSLHAADLSQGMNTPIRGEALASLRPFSDLKLSVLDDFDRVLRAFQSQVTAVRIAGTAQDPKVANVSIDETFALVSRLLSGH